ncbi:hypothetical protein D3C81_1013560 [compost metagenome]
MFHQLLGFVVARGAIGQGVAQGVQRHGVFRLALDDEAQVLFHLGQVVAFLGEHGAGVEQVQVIRELLCGLLDDLPGALDFTAIGQPLRLDQIELDGIVGLAVAGFGEVPRGIVDALGVEEDFRLAQLCREEVVARADQRVFA